MLPVLAHIPGHHLSGVLRQLEVDRLAIFDLMLRNDEVKPLAARHEMPLDVELGKIERPKRRNQQDRDGDRPLRKIDLKAEKVKGDDGQNPHVRNFLDCMKSRALPICDVEIGHRSATVCHLGNIAVRLGRKIRWDPAAERIVGDEEAAQWIDRPRRSPYTI